MFSDASSGASQHFTYEFEQHTAEIQKYIHLYTGKPGDTEIAVMCPTTLYRLGGDLSPTISGGAQLRGLAEYDVLDELLITDGALTNEKFKTLIIFQPDFVEAAVLDRIEAWTKSGGTLILFGDKSLKDVAGDVRDLPALRVTKVEELTHHLAGQKGCDGKLDGLMTCRRGDQVFIYNANDKPTPVSIDLRGASADIVVEPHTIWSNR
jgi:hypothetical protein